MPRFLPYHSLVNVQALTAVLGAAEAYANHLDCLDNGQADQARVVLLENINKIESDMKWSRENSCGVCGGAGMGNDGDTWDLSDTCTSCGGLGIVPPKE